MGDAAPTTVATGVAERLAAGRHSWSFEFFPPRTDEGERILWRALRELEPLRPSFVSVTYGAGGSTQDRTVRLTGQIATETTLTPVGHLTCVGASRAQLRAVVGSYAAAGVTNILALRGDPASGPGAPWESFPDGLDHADELVRLVKSSGRFCVGVAAFPDGHPESEDLDADARVLAAKADAGAEFAVTQLFFSVARYVELVRLARRHGCTIPIIAGLMPVTDVAQLERFSRLSGAAVPGSLVRRFDAVRDDPAAVRALGVDVATQLASELLDEGAPGLHFFTLNRSTATREVYRNLDLAHRD